MADTVSLSSSVRANLLALQTTAELINRTQGRLSTGLRVASAVDDPVSFFQAKSLNDRAADFDVKKRGIDQGISTITAASDAVTGIENIVQQLKGLVLTAKSAATTTELDNLVLQFNDLRSQINNLASDASYQGLNLVNGTGQTLTVNFSNDTASVLNVGSYDLRSQTTGLNINKLTATTATVPDNGTWGFQAGSSIAAFTLSGGGKISGGTFDASPGVISGDSSIGLLSATLDTVSLSLIDVYGSTSYVLASGDVFSVTIGTETFKVLGVSSRSASSVLSANTIQMTAGTYSAGTYNFLVVSAAKYDVSDSVAGNYSAGFSQLADTAMTDVNFGGFFRATAVGSGGLVSIAAYTGTETFTRVGINFSSAFNARINNLDAALTTLRSRAQSLGSNVALLQTRLGFTKAYISTLTTGAGKLNLADLNEEGANLLALQTRQQLGIQSLAFAGQAEQTILTLFR